MIILSSCIADKVHGSSTLFTPSRDSVDIGFAILVLHEAFEVGANCREVVDSKALLRSSGMKIIWGSSSVLRMLLPCSAVLVRLTFSSGRFARVTADPWQDSGVIFLPE